jgi:hypothetical protein
MKKFVWISLAIIALGFYACDKVSNPYLSKATGVKPTIPPTNVDSTNTNNTNRDTSLRILEEDYTGHLCQNCPRQGQKCEALLSQYPNNVVLLEVNTSLTYAVPYTVGEIGGGNVDSAYLVDYRTATGTNWDGQYAISTNGLPGAMVNRLYYNGAGNGSADLILRGANVSGPGDSLIMKNNHLATIHIVDSMYAPPTSTLSMSITTKILNPVAGNKYYLVVTLAEDSIIDWQDSLTTNVQYYLKRMTLRGSINDGGIGTGDSLVANDVPQTKHYVYTNTRQFKYNSAIIRRPTANEGNQWNMAHMYIVAFVYQVTTGLQSYMVLQAQQLHL